MIRFKQYLLTEKTFNLNKDVDMIYNKFFKKVIDDLKKGIWDGKIKSQTIKSSQLKSANAISANSLNPIPIILNTKEKLDMNFYDTSENERKIILSLPMYTIHQIRMNNNNFEKAFKKMYVTGNRKILMQNNISESGLKATIYHELSHWVNDSLHNFNLTTAANIRTKKYNKSHGTISDKKMYHGHKDAITTDYELDAYIHTIKQIKRTINNKTWDSWSFNDLLDKNASLNSVKTNSEFIGEFKNWKKRMLKRMARERLLGKNMKGREIGR